MTRKGGQAYFSVSDLVNSICDIDDVDEIGRTSLHSISRKVRIKAISHDRKTVVYSINNAADYYLSLKVSKGSLFTDIWSVFARFDDEYALYYREKQPLSNRVDQVWFVSGVDAPNKKINSGGIDWFIMRRLQQQLELMNIGVLVFAQLLGQYLIALPLSRERATYAPPMPLMFMFSYLTTVTSCPMEVQHSSIASDILALSTVLASDEKNSESHSLYLEKELKFDHNYRDRKPSNIQLAIDLILTDGSGVFIKNFFPVWFADETQVLHCNLFPDITNATDHDTSPWHLLLNNAASVMSKNTAVRVVALIAHPEGDNGTVVLLESIHNTSWLENTRFIALNAHAVWRAVKAMNDLTLSVTALEKIITDIGNISILDYDDWQRHEDDMLVKTKSVADVPSITIDDEHIEQHNDCMGNQASKIEVNDQRPHTDSSNEVNLFSVDGNNDGVILEIQSKNDGGDTIMNEPTSGNECTKTGDIAFIGTSVWGAVPPPSIPFYNALQTILIAAAKLKYALISNDEDSETVSQQLSRKAFANIGVTPEKPLIVALPSLLVHTHFLDSSQSNTESTIKTSVSNNELSTKSPNPCVLLDSSIRSQNQVAEIAENAIRNIVHISMPQQNIKNSLHQKVHSALPIRSNLQPITLDFTDNLHSAENTNIVVDANNAPHIPHEEGKSCWVLISSSSVMNIKDHDSAAMLADPKETDSPTEHGNSKDSQAIIDPECSAVTTIESSDELDSIEHMIVCDEESKHYAPLSSMTHYEESGSSSASPEILQENLNPAVEGNGNTTTGKLDQYSFKKENMSIMVGGSLLRHDGNNVYVQPRKGNPEEALFPLTNSSVEPA